ncbi:MipA/OmpV family protein [Herbaspirillum lusitanum]|uniref:MipA/OmpV family protein n=1 Tax=Herbaspirillum lusitanum TaxID=213312 RepID=A0ABW9AFB6_9BURK
MIKTSIAVALSLLCAGPAMAQQSQSSNDDFPDHIKGDLGAGVFRLDRNVVTKSDHTTVLPYAYFDYGRFFARLDTFGIKTVKLGAGYLELAARVNFEGIKDIRGLSDRSNPIPIGIGTLQETPYGAFFLNAFYDVNKSHGTLLEAIYAAQFDVGPVSIYPQVGIERRSGSYNNYFFGISQSEAGASGYREYHAGASTSPMLGLSAQMPINDKWNLNFTWRRKWLGSAVADSPIVKRSTENMALLAVSYNFK